MPTDEPTRITDVEINRDASSWVDYGGGMMVPDSFAIRAKLEDPSLFVEIRAELQDRRYVPTEVVARQVQGGPPVDSDTLRTVPVASILQMVAGDFRPVAGSELERIHQRLEGRWPTIELGELGPTPDNLVLASSVYLGAWIRGLPPTQQVAQQFGISVRQATYWITKARAAGLLGSTTPGKAGG